MSDTDAMTDAEFRAIATLAEETILDIERFTAALWPVIHRIDAGELKELQASAHRLRAIVDGLVR
jgi:hypothetical protein